MSGHQRCLGYEHHYPCREYHCMDVNQRRQRWQSALFEIVSRRKSGKDGQRANKRHAREEKPVGVDGSLPCDSDGHSRSPITS